MTIEMFTNINWLIIFIVLFTIYSLYNSKKDDPSGLKSLPSIFTILGVVKQNGRMVKHCAYNATC